MNYRGICSKDFTVCYHLSGGSSGVCCSRLSFRLVCFPDGYVTKDCVIGAALLNIPS